METNNNPMTIALYEVILNMATRTPSLQRTEQSWHENPVNVKDRTLATNGHIVVSTPLFVNKFDDGTAKTYAWIHMPRNCNHTISVAAILEATEKARVVDDYYSEMVDCIACDGSGNVDFEFSFGVETYYEREDCPVCNGGGRIRTKEDKPNGRKLIDYDYRVEIGTSQFAIKYIAILVRIALLLKSETVTLVAQTASNKGSLFAIGDVEVYIMPMYYDCDKFKVIEIKW